MLLVAVDHWQRPWPSLVIDLAARSSEPHNDVALVILYK